jgi:drug/metabolite transporter (DMT)-like permease
MIYTIATLIVRIFANPVANVFQKQLTRGSVSLPYSGANPLTVNMMTYFLLSIGCVVPALGVDWMVLPREFWWNCLLVGVFGGVGNAFLVKALQCGELSVLGPINSWKSVVGMLVGVVVLGEIPGLWGLCGMALIVVGSYFVLMRRGEPFSWQMFMRRDIRWRFWAMILTATEAVFIKRVVVMTSPSVSFIVWCWFGALASLVVAMIFARRELCQNLFLKRRLNFGVWYRSFEWRYFAIAVCVGLSQYATNVIFGRMNVGYALSLFQLSAVVSVFLGYKVFKESDIRRKLTGAAIMIAGSVVIIFLN